MTKSDLQRGSREERKTARQANRQKGIDADKDRHTETYRQREGKSREEREKKRDSAVTTLDTGAVRCGARCAAVEMRLLVMEYFDVGIVKERD